MSEETKAQYRERAENGKKWCYDCIHYINWYRWGECECKIHGWMGVGQTAMHPDTSADECKDYSHPSGEPLWFENNKYHLGKF